MRDRSCRRAPSTLAHRPSKLLFAATAAASLLSTVAVMAAPTSARTSVALAAAAVATATAPTTVATAPNPVVEALRERVDAIRAAAEGGGSGGIEAGGEPLRATQTLPQLYQMNGFQPLWDALRLRSLVELLRDIEDDGLRPSDYHLAPLQQLLGRTHTRR